MKEDGYNKKDDHVAARLALKDASRVGLVSP